MAAPQKNESPVSAGQFVKQKTNDLDYPTGKRQRKEEATLLARLALAGHHVHIGRCDDYTVCKYGYAQYCQDLATLAGFANELGVLQ